MLRSLPLQRFEAVAAKASTAAVLPVSLLAEVGWSEVDAPTLDLHYSLTGSTAALVVPAPLQLPSRRDDLWQHTCFEAFLAVPGEEHYWELNLAPSGAWNLYRLDGYRRNLRPETCCQSVPIHWRVKAEQASLQARLSLPAELAAAETLELGLSAVLERNDRELEYWALCHPLPDADFHRREGFRVRLAAADRNA